MSAVTSASAAAPKQCPSCGNRYAVDALFCPIDGSPLTTAASSSAVSQVQDSYLGREILEHIEIKQLAGVGAMGRVYRAFQKGIDRDVAVKILHRELSSNQQLVARFLREAKVASRLQHPHVVHVHLAGQLPDGSMYMVMEYLDGMSLQSALAAVGGVMELPRALQITLALCDAVGEAHAQGVVHRDIKPENVMLVHRGEDTDYVKVLDFGIARLSWGDQSMATAAGLIFGTARYISPEGAQGETVGPAADVYGIATLLYQMLAGRTPFEGEQAVGLLIQQIHDPPPELRSIPRAAYVPEPIARVIMRNLAKRPEGRDADARVLGRALVEAARASGLSPDELMPRSVLLGRAAGPMQIASMQRTRQLRLDAETNARMGAARTSYEPPPPAEARPTVASATYSTPAHPTTKWSPPADVKARMEVAFPPPRNSSVDTTLDDAAPSPPRAPLPSAPTPLPVSPSHPSVPPSRPSKPSSGVGSTLGEGDDVAVPRRTRSRAAVLVFFCFLLGVGVAAGVAYKLGFVTPSTPALTREHQIALAHDALIHQQWEAPPGQNVLELTTDGLVRWPNDLELLRIRALACDEIIRVAREAYHAGDLANALHLMKLAHELDPSDDDAARLSGEWQTELDHGSSTMALAPVDGGAASASEREAEVDLRHRRRRAAASARRAAGRLRRTHRRQPGRRRATAARQPGVPSDGTRRPERRTRRGGLRRRRALPRELLARLRRSRRGRVRREDGRAAAPVRAARPGVGRHLDGADGTAERGRHDDGTGAERIDGQVALTMRASWIALACAALFATPRVAYADPALARVDGQSTFERSSLLDRPHTVAEFEAGVLALPNAPISPANEGGSTFLGKFGKGDATLATGIHFFYRGGRDWALGASAYFAPFPTADTNYDAKNTIARTHSRSYLSLGPEFRWFPIRFKWFELWLGATAGVVVIGDRFSTVGGGVPSDLGSRQYTVSTTGFSAGLASGGDYMLSDNWVVGLRLRGEFWTLPQIVTGPTPDPSCSSIGDCPTLGGSVFAFQIGLSIGYRIPL